MSFSNPRYNRYGTIDVDLNHPVLGVIPFTVTPDSGEPNVDEMWQGLQQPGTIIAPFVAPTPSSEPVDLKRKQFEWLLYSTGLDQVWEAISEAAFQSGDLATYANLKAERHNGTYRLTVTLALVAQFRPQATALLPNIDLTDATITAAWEQAAIHTFLNQSVSTGEE